MFVDVGDHVDEGDVIGLVGVMKNYNEIESSVSGTVTEILVENESEIDAGDPLVEIEAE